MWRGAVVLAGCVLVGGCALVRGRGGPFAVSEEGRAACRIVAAEEHAEAAGELQHWLKEVTGAEIPVETSPGEGTAIVLGTADALPDLARKERLGRLGPEGFAVRSTRQRLWVVGNSPLAVRHGVFALLDAVGCRWFFPDPVWTVVPHRPSLTVDVALRESPAFAYRRIWYGWGARTAKLRDDYTAWQKHNRQLGHFMTDCGHSHERYVPRAKFKDHPEWFAVVKGKRTAPQLCTSDPEAEQQVIDGVLAAFRKDPKRNMVSVDPNDGAGYCECEKCKALGSASDRVFLLAGNVAKAVRKEFPDKWVGLYAYAYHCEPPRQPFPPGVYVQVTTGFRYTKLSFDEQVTAFRKLGARLGVYDYFSVYAWDWDLPGKPQASRLYQLAERIRHYRDLGLSTYDAESSCNWGPNGLGYWAGAKLMWNPDLDPEELADDFCTRAFGAAAEPMRRIYERWATGERLSQRGLKLALADLKEAYGRTQDAGVRARLDRVAMYLHCLRLWVDYDRGARWNQWNKLAAGSRDEVLRRAKEVIVYSARLMDTGLIHAYPMLFTGRFEARFGALKRIKDFDLKTTEAWKKERSDIPTAEEAARNFAADLESVAELNAVELEGRAFGDMLVPLAERMPAAVKAWGEVARSPLCVETGEHFFAGKAGEKLKLSLTPFGTGHQVKGHWVLRRAGGAKAVAEGDVEVPKEKVATLELTLPEDGVYALEPGTGFWRTAELGFERRPLSVWAGRADAPGRPRRKPLRFWLPNPKHPLYFFVPKGTRSFVVCISSGGDPQCTVALRTADGAAVLSNEHVLARDQLSVRVPKGKDGQVWSVAVKGLRSVLELYDVPPYVARHPAELLVPAQAVQGEMLP